MVRSAVIDARASIKVLDRSYINLATPMGRGFTAMLSALAEDERLRIVRDDEAFANTDVLPADAVKHILPYL